MENSCILVGVAEPEQLLFVEEGDFIEIHVINIKPLQTPGQQNKSSKWIYLLLCNVTKLESKCHVNELTAEGHLDSSLVCGIELSWAYKLHCNPSE